MIGLLEVVVVAGVLLAAASWLVVVCFAPQHRSDPTSSPARRLSSARLWLYAPFWAPVTLLVAALMPGVVGALLERGDHCLTQAGHDHHLCLLHPPHAAEHALSWMLPVVLFVPVLYLLARCGRRAWREWRLTRALVASSRPSGPLALGADVRILERPEPLAFTVGWWRPVILVSTGLLEGASDATLRVVLAHERAHVQRGDTRRALFDRFAASILPAVMRRSLMGRITLAREQACDAIAARDTGGPLVVASALTDVMRLGLAAPRVGVSMSSGSLEARVTHLLHPPVENRRWLSAPLVCVGLFVVAGAGPVHTALERLVSLLLH